MPANNAPPRIFKVATVVIQDKYYELAINFKIHHRFNNFIRGYLADLSFRPKIFKPPAPAAD